MAKVFNITASNTNVKLDEKGTGQVSVTITNTLGQNIRGRAAAKPLGNTKKEWLSIEGADERDFPSQTAQQFIAKIAIPPGTEPGTYTFRVDAYGLDNPDENYDEGQSIAVEVKKSEAPVEPKKFPMWIIPVIIVVLLIVGGITTWLLVRGNGGDDPPVVAESTVPNVVSLPFDQAQTKLTDAGFTVDKKGPVANLEFQPGTVTKQNPPGLASAPEGSQVTVTVAGKSVKVPRLKGLGLLTAMQRLSDKDLIAKVKGDSKRLNEKVVSSSPQEDSVVLAKSQVTILMPGSPVIVKYPFILKQFKTVSPAQKSLFQKMQRAVEMEEEAVEGQNK